VYVHSFRWTSLCLPPLLGASGAAWLTPTCPPLVTSPRGATGGWSPSTRSPPTQPSCSLPTSWTERKRHIHQASNGHQIAGDADSPTAQATEVPHACSLMALMHFLVSLVEGTSDKQCIVMILSQGCLVIQVRLLVGSHAHCCMSQIPTWYWLLGTGMLHDSQRHMALPIRTPKLLVSTFP
jgi:hypothetical protein